MKNIFKILFVALVGLFVVSCSTDADNDLATLGNASSTATLTADKSTVVLTKPNADQKAITFTFAAPQYGTSVGSQNVLEFAVKGSNFTPVLKSVDLPAGATSATFTVAQLNSILLGMGLSTNSSSQIEVRLKSKVQSLDDAATNIPVVYSAPITLTVTPYALISYIYSPGAYQGWDPTTSNALVSATSNGIYVGYINFPSAGSEFKITADKSWTTNYGDDGANGTLELNGANIASPGAGFYKVTVDMNAKTYTMVPYAMGIVGSATPNQWNGPDLQMSWDNATNSWTYTGTFAAGEIKFRTNNSWTENYGGANGVIGTDNIVVSAGTHTVKFNPFTMTYSVQ